jgi:hypothetical protein
VRILFPIGSSLTTPDKAVFIWHALNAESRLVEQSGGLLEGMTNVWIGRSLRLLARRCGCLAKANFPRPVRRRL